MRVDAMKRQVLFAALAGGLCLGLPGHAPAQTYPNRTIKIVVPTGAGGSYDIVGRLIGQQLSERLHQPVVIENRTGAGSIVGTQSVVSSAPDGYTLLVGGLSNIVFNASLRKTLSYDPLKDLVPVGIFYKFTYILVGDPKLPYNSVKEIIEAARAKPNSINVGNAGVGTGQHLAGVAFQKYTGTTMLEVPYRGASAVYPDLMSGRVNLFFDSAAAALPYIKSGKIKGFAALASHRLSAAPDIPTMTETGVSNLEIDSWIGLFAPAKTPASVIAVLQKEISASLPALKPTFEKIGGEGFEVPPDKLTSFVGREYDMWTGIIKEAKISVD